MIGSGKVNWKPVICNDRCEFSRFHLVHVPLQIIFSRNIQAQVPHGQQHACSTLPVLLCYLLGFRGLTAGMIISKEHPP